MKIGNYELNEDESRKVNEILSKFLGSSHVVIEGKPPPSGRSSNDKQFVLNVDNIRHVSVKRAYDTPDNIKWELFMADARIILGLPHYKLTKEVDFPISTWKDTEYIIIDWGNIDRRFPISHPNVQQSLIENRETFLSQLGNIAAQNHLFATADRKNEHFIWDLDDKVLFSIDHEIPASTDIEVLDYFRNDLKQKFGINWYDTESQRDLFLKNFQATWLVAEQQKSQIVSNYTKYGLDAYSTKFLERMSIGSLQALQRIMS